MNRDVALTTPDGSWPIQQYDSSAITPQREHILTLDLPTLLKILLEWRWLILSTIAGGLALGLVYTMLTTPMYRSWIILQVNPPTVEILDEKQGDRAETPATSDFVATQAGLLSSKSLAQQVAQDLNLASDPGFVSQDVDPGKRLQAAAAKISEGLKVIEPQEGQLIRFSFDSDSPVIAAKVANGIADAFINSNLQRRYESSAYARNFLQRQIAKTRTDLERSERELVAYAQAQGIINTASDQSSSSLVTDANSPVGQSLSETNTALAEATAKRVAAEAAYRAALNNGITSVETQSTQQLRQDRAVLEAQYQQKRTLMKADHPEMLSLRSQIAELDRQISRETANVTNGRINALRADYQAAAAAERGLQARLVQLKSDVLNLRGRSIRYAILQRDVDTNRALYDALLQRYKEIGVAGGIGIAPVSIVDHAETPSAPFKPILIVDLLVGLAAGFLVGVLAAIVLEFLNDTIKTREDVRKKLGLACLGVVPKRTGKGDFIEDLKDSTSGISEAYSTIAASLGFATEHGAPKVLLLTSSRPAEGKSSSALALAHNYSRRGKSVLLIDCDIRKPAFSRRSNDKGLTQLLTNDDPISDHISATHFEFLHLLPAGAIPPNPADLLSTGRFHSIIREASAQYEIVIIDAPPVIGLADAPLIASLAKNVMFVVESGKTRTSMAREAVNKLQAAGAHIVGVALTKSPEGKHGYGYGYGYGYKYKYGALDKKRTEIALIPEQVQA